jgi:hypothetical protein
VPGLGALSQAWTAAQASLPMNWQIVGLWRFGEVWISPPEGPAIDDDASGSGRHEYLALQRLSDRLRERRGKASG